VGVPGVLPPGTDGAGVHRRRSDREAHHLGDALHWLRDLRAQVPVRCDQDPEHARGVGIGDRASLQLQWLPTLPAPPAADPGDHGSVGAQRDREVYGAQDPRGHRAAQPGTVRRSTRLARDPRSLPGNRDLGASQADRRRNAARGGQAPVRRADRSGRGVRSGSMSAPTRRCGRSGSTRSPTAAFRNSRAESSS